MKKRKKKSTPTVTPQAEEAVPAEETTSEAEETAPVQDTAPTAPEAEGSSPVEEGSPLDRLRPAERAALIAALASRMRREAEEEEEEALAALASDPSYADIRLRAESMRALQKDFPFLAELDAKDRLTAAYHIDRSLHPDKLSPTEQLEELLADPALLSALSEKFAALVAAKRESLPPMLTRGGMSAPPADRRPLPRDLREASAAAKRSLGIEERK